MFVRSCARGGLGPTSGRPPAHAALSSHSPRACKPLGLSSPEVRGLGSPNQAGEMSDIPRVTPADQSSVTKLGLSPRCGPRIGDWTSSKMLQGRWCSQRRQKAEGELFLPASHGSPFSPRCGRAMPPPHLCCTDCFVQASLDRTIKSVNSGAGLSLFSPWVHGGRELPSAPVFWVDLGSSAPSKGSGCRGHGCVWSLESASFGCILL